MELIINVLIILVGAVLFFIFLRQNFTGKSTGPDSGTCDCSSCSSQTCVTRNNTTINPDK